MKGYSARRTIRDKHTFFDKIFGIRSRLGAVPIRITDQVNSATLQISKCWPASDGTYGEFLGRDNTPHNPRRIYISIAPVPDSTCS